MESFNDSKLKVSAYRSISQNGKGLDMDRYIYSQQGEGIGSFFGNLLKSAQPMLGKAIKGVAKVVAPHLKAAGQDLVKAGVKRVNKQISHQPHKKRKRTEWQSL